MDDRHQPRALPGPSQAPTLGEIRALASNMFEAFQRHGHSIKDSIEQSLEAAELLVVRSIARDKARREAEAQRIERERLAAEGGRELVAEIVS